uniref:Uncharacterized protein n=1 Tax=Plectus sambesii TaxID=2011161 RepID=A0A914XKF9_9BILA
MEGEPVDLLDDTIVRLNISFSNRKLKVDLSKAVLRTVVRNDKKLKMDLSKAVLRTVVRKEYLKRLEGKNKLHEYLT